MKNLRQFEVLYKLIQLNEAGADPYTNEEVLMEDRIDFIKNKYRDKLNTEHDHSRNVETNSDKIVDRISQDDPSPKKIYTDWMTRQYQKKGFSQEDAYRVGDALDKFHKNKSSLPEKDINKYDVESLNSAVKDLKSEAPLTNAQKNAELDTKGRTHVWGDDKINIYRLENTPEGKQASINVYGGGHDAGGHHTSWCTTAGGNRNMFDTYSKDSPLYVIHEKGMGDAEGKDKVYQYHVNSNQFMDARDNEIGHDDFKRIAPSLNKAWSEKPELTADEPWEDTKKKLAEHPHDYKQVFHPEMK